ncbi:helix-turn-helix domain-containing protein [Flavihumibacter sp. UBA7668]|uniref:helix-turn-helix domain-containing protein n=1 Tax=Flavihumibacter sp. UBA7668 TaxID=1946542 RepID=UPI0025BC1E95|nr:helix-turn-helix transcriptional regulator [Flavihumibacter sp. UBA7668]
MAAAGKKFNRIKIVLLEKEKSNIWLSEALDVSITAVSKWCTNRNQPTVEMLFRIAEVLDVEVADLLRKVSDRC